MNENNKRKKEEQGGGGGGAAARKGCKKRERKPKGKRDVDGLLRDCFHRSMIKT